MRLVLLPLVLVVLVLSAVPGAAQSGTGRIGVGLTILDPVSTDRSGPPTVRRSRSTLDVDLPAAAGVAPVVEVTMERGGLVAACPPRPRPAGRAAPGGMHRAACPIHAAAEGTPARIRVVIVPVS